MKRWLLTAGTLLTGLVMFAGSLTVVGTALRQPVRDTVIAVRDSATVSPTEARLQFPFSVEGTPLIAEGIAVYEGPSLEEGSDEPLAETLALIVRNTGKEQLLSIKVRLEGQGEAYRFAASYVPGQSRVLMIEQDLAPWTADGYISCTGDSVCVQDAGLLPDTVEVTETAMGELAVTNLTQQRLTEVVILHKNCLNEGDIFVGGITYRTPVGEIAPAQTVLVYPRRYASGYSKVVRIEGCLRE